MGEAPRAARAGVLDEIRDACRRVSATAHLVGIDDAALERMVVSFDAERPAPVYPGVYYRGDPDTTAAYVLILETVNFGSGWFPHVRKRPGCSGHFTVAASLTDLARRGELWDANGLSDLNAAECADVFGQERTGPAFELMVLFATALNDLGELLSAEYDGSPAALVEAADNSAEQLVVLLDRLPYFHDVGHLDGLEVPFYKRAQICSATLASAFDHTGPGRFDDLHRLTMFADNLVPHVLWCEGVLRFDPALVERIAAEEVLPTGGREEIELRAGAVEAVERIVARVRDRRGTIHSSDHPPRPPIDARAIDESLWHRGQLPEFKAKPRPRFRTTAF